MQWIGWMWTDEFGWRIGNSISSKHCQTTADKLVNNTSTHVRSASGDLTCTFEHQQYCHTLWRCFFNLQPPRTNTTTLATTTPHCPMTLHIRPPTTSPPYDFTQRQCQKRHRLPKKDDNHPTNTHDRLTTTTTARTQHNHPKTTTSAYEKHQQAPPAHPTAP